MKYAIGDFIEIDFDKEINRGHTGYPSNQIYNGIQIFRQIVDYQYPELSNRLGCTYCINGEPVYKIKIYTEKFDKNGWYNTPHYHYSTESDLDTFYKKVTYNKLSNK